MTNNRNKRTFEFDVADAPMLVRAFSLAACTAMMCGHPKAKERFLAYQKIVKQFAPPEAKLFDEEIWAEMGMALVNADCFHVYIDKSRWDKEFNPSSGGVMYVRIGEKEFHDNRLCDRFKPGAPEIEAVCKALQEIAPMDCVGTFENRAVEFPYYVERAKETA